MTYSEFYNINLNTCDRKDWKSEYYELTQKIFTSVVIGIFQNVEV